MNSQSEKYKNNSDKIDIHVELESRDVSIPDREKTKKTANKEKVVTNTIRIKNDQSYVSHNYLNRKEEDLESVKSKDSRINTYISKHERILHSITGDNPMDFLEIAKIAVINQIVDKKVFESGCEPSIRYMIEIVTYMGEVKRIFNCRETPRWCQKNCCHSDAREYSLEIDRDLEEEDLDEEDSYVSEVDDSKSNNSQIDSNRKINEKNKKESNNKINSDVSNKLKKNATLDKKTTFDHQETFTVEKRDPYALIFKLGRFFTCCSDKPTTYIRTIKPENIIGSIEEPSNCCNFTLSIKDSKEQEKYRIDASSLQCGIGWRGSIFGKCYEVFFPIFLPGNPSRNVEAADGLIHKRHTACVREEEVENPEAIEVLFPKDCITEDKFLLICAALTIDYRFYEENPNEVEKEVNVDGG